MELKKDFIDLIGNTPLLRLKRASEETGCEILGKCEFLNPGQSVKDRAALFIVPTVLGSLPGFGWLGQAFNTAGFAYIAFYTGLIIFFSFMWTRLMFQPDEIANNLKEHGSFIPGIRPGKATSEYLSFVLDRVTLAGAVFLASIAVMPNLLVGNLHVDPMVAYFLGGTSILIVVGVALDMVDRLNAQLMMRNYEGFIR